MCLCGVQNSQKWGLRTITQYEYLISAVTFYKTVSFAVHIAPVICWLIKLQIKKKKKIWKKFAIALFVYSFVNYKIALSAN